MNVLTIILIASALILGVLAGFLIANSRLNVSARKEKENLIKEAEVRSEAIRQEKILQSKEKFLQLKGEHEKAVQEKNAHLQQQENRIKQKESELNKKLEEYNRKDKEVE